MKSYHYTAQELGLDKLPPGELRLGGFERTTNPQEADVFVVPPDIKHLSAQQIQRLPYLKGNEARTAFFCISDQPKRTLGIPAIIFRADCNQTIMRGDPTTIPWPWPVNPTRDIDDFVHPPREGFKHDVCFVGWNSTPLTEQACKSVQAHRDLNSFIELNNEFFGSWESREELGKVNHYRHLMLNVMHNSRLSLCARSIAVGVVRYRFYEGMAMARLVVHINDGEVLPFAGQIDWDKIRIRIPESEVARTGAILREWLDAHTDADILERGVYARQMWETWLDGRDWDKHFGWCVRERLAGRL